MKAVLKIKQLKTYDYDFGGPTIDYMYVSNFSKDLNETDMTSDKNEAHVFDLTKVEDLNKLNSLMMLGVVDGKDLTDCIQNEDPMIYDIGAEIELVSEYKLSVLPKGA